MNKDTLRGSNRKQLRGNQRIGKSDRHDRIIRTGNPLSRILACLIICVMLVANLIPAYGQDETGSFSIFGILGKQAFTTRVITASGENFTIEVTCGPDAKIPRDAELWAEELDPESDDYKDYLSETAQKLDVDAEEGIVFARYFDIEIRSGEEKIEPMESVDVKVIYEDPLELEEDEEILVVHFAETETELIDAELNSESKEGAQIGFVQGSFSVTGTVIRKAETGGDESDAFPKDPGEYMFLYFWDHDNDGHGTWVALGADGTLTTVYVGQKTDLTVGTEVDLNSLSEEQVGNNTWEYRDIIEIGHAGSADTYYGYHYFFHDDVTLAGVNSTLPNVENSMTVGGSGNYRINKNDYTLDSSTGNYRQVPNLGTGAGAADFLQISFNLNKWRVIHPTDPDYGNTNYVSINKSNTQFLKLHEGYVLNPLNTNGCYYNQHYDYRHTGYGGFMLVDKDNPDHEIHHRIHMNPVFDTDGYAVITLPSNDMLAAGDVTTGDVKLVQRSDTYQWRLQGWYNIATGEYYDVSSGPVTARISKDNDNVFYADWVPASYPTVMPDNVYPDTESGTDLYTPDSSDFCTIRLYDYSELFNLLHINVTQEGTESETWTDPQTGIIFSNNSVFAPRSGLHVWQGGTIGNADERWAGNEYNNYAPYGHPGILADWPNSLAELFPSSSGLGVEYVGPGNRLFVYDPVTHYYVYDSDQMGAVYNQAEQRFYVTNVPRYHQSDGRKTITGFFPFQNWGDDLKAWDGSTNYWFGMNTELTFWLPDDITGADGHLIDGNKINGEDMIFSFSGDDDLWVFVDDELVLDLGGVHNKITGSINFSTGTVTAEGQETDHEHLKNLKAGGHTLRIYYMERGGNASNCRIQFNIAPKWKQEPSPASTMKVEKVWDHASEYDESQPLTIQLRKKGDSSPEGLVDTITLPRSIPDPENPGETILSWEYTWERLDPEEQYEVVEVLTEKQQAYYEQTGSVRELVDQEYEYWTLADSDKLQNGSIVLIGSNRNVPPEGDPDKDYLLAVENGSITTQKTNILYNIVERGYAREVVKWTIETTGMSDGSFRLKKDGQYLSFNRDTGQVFLTSDGSSASRYMFSTSGDLYDPSTNMRLAVGAAGLYATKEGMDHTQPNVDRVSVFADQTVASQVYKYTIDNALTHQKLRIVKMDDDETVFLSDAEFELYQEVGDASDPTKVKDLLEIYLSDPHGSEGAEAKQQLINLGALQSEMISMENTGVLQAKENPSEVTLDEDRTILQLPYGTYYLIETKAPVGYNKLIHIRTITISEDGVSADGSLTTQKTLTFSDGETTYEDVPVWEDKVHNGKGVSLPNTGGSGTLPYTLSGLMLVILSALMYGFAMRRRERRLQNSL